MVAKTLAPFANTFMQPGQMFGNKIDAVGDAANLLI